MEENWKSVQDSYKYRWMEVLPFFSTVIHEMHMPTLQSKDREAQGLLGESFVLSSSKK